MKKPKYVLWILLAEATGILSGLLSRKGMDFYSQMVTKPAFSPPEILFPIVWSILYALMGIGAARVAASEPGRDRSWALNGFVIQLIVNFFWSLIFFNGRAYGAAFAWLLLLWILIIAMIYLFSKVDRLATWLQLPYFLWVSFAAFLNYSVWQRNL